MFSISNLFWAWNEYHCNFHQQEEILSPSSEQDFENDHTFPPSGFALNTFLSRIVKPHTQASKVQTFAPLLYQHENFQVITVLEDPFLN